MTCTYFRIIIHSTAYHHLQITWLSYFGSENQGLPLRSWFVTCWLWRHIPIVTSLAVPSSCVVTQTPMGTNSGTRRRKRKFPLLFVNCDRGRIEIDHLYGLRCRGCVIWLPVETIYFIPHDHSSYCNLLKIVGEKQVTFSTAMFCYTRVFVFMKKCFCKSLCRPDWFQFSSPKNISESLDMIHPLPSYIYQVLHWLSLFNINVNTLRAGAPFTNMN